MENRNKKRSNGMGFYIALCCCVTVLGIVGYINNRSAKPDSEYETELIESDLPQVTPNTIIQQEPIPDVSEPVGSEADTNLIPDDSEPISAPYNTGEEYTDSVEASGNIEAEPEVIEYGENEQFYDGETVASVSIIEQPSFTAPLSGEIIEAFEIEKLLYNPALGDWRTHNGVDIQGDAGTAVCASCDGEIMDIYEDAYGTTVIMTHGNNFKTVYSNLADVSALSIGQEIKKGEKLSTLGSYTSGERATENHLHFELIKDRDPINPEDYIEFE